MLKFTKFLKAKSSLITARKCSTSAYSPNNIAKTRRIQRSQYVSRLSLWSERKAEKYLDTAKKALVASDKFPVTLRYNDVVPTDDCIIYVIYHLKELGYTISDVREVTRYAGAAGVARSSAILNISLPSSSPDGSTQL